MVDKNTAAPTEYPDYLLEVMGYFGRIRDFHTVMEDVPVVVDQQVSNNNIMFGWQFDELFNGANGILFEMYRQGRVTINNIRDVHNPTPILEVDPPLPPEPDPIDGYYYDPGTLGYSNVSNPTSSTPLSPGPSMRYMISPRPRPVLGPIPIPRPWPPDPWPPWPPPPPPPTYWRPVAEEDWSYFYAYYTMIDVLVATRQPSKLDLEYTGYFAMEMTKRAYELYRFWFNEDYVRRYFGGSITPRLALLFR